MTRITELYVVQDTLANDCGPVFEAASEAVAVRSYRAMMAKSPYPADFRLIRVGYLEISDMGEPEITPEIKIVNVSVHAGTDAKTHEAERLSLVQEDRA